MIHRTVWLGWCEMGGLWVGLLTTSTCHIFMTFHLTPRLKKKNCTQLWLVFAVPTAFDLLRKVSSRCHLQVQLLIISFFESWGVAKWSTSPFFFFISFAPSTSPIKRWMWSAALFESSEPSSRKGRSWKREGKSAMFASVGTFANHALVLLAISIWRCIFITVPAASPRPTPGIWEHASNCRCPCKALDMKLWGIHSKHPRQAARNSSSQIIIPLSFIPNMPHISQPSFNESQALQRPSASTSTAPRPPLLASLS